MFLLFLYAICRHDRSHVHNNAAYYCSLCKSHCTFCLDYIDYIYFILSYFLQIVYLIYRRERWRQACNFWWTAVHGWQVQICIGYTFQDPQWNTSLAHFLHQPQRLTLTKSAWESVCQRTSEKCGVAGDRKVVEDWHGLNSSCYYTLCSSCLPVLQCCT